LQDNSHFRNIDFGLPSNKEKEILKKEVANDHRSVNKHDPKIFASFLVKDAKWTDIMGYTIILGTEIDQQHIYPSQTVLKAATLEVNLFGNK
jgi:hypothetical protein